MHHPATNCGNDESIKHICFSSFWLSVALTHFSETCTFLYCHADTKCFMCQFWQKYAIWLIAEVKYINPGGGCHNKVEVALYSDQDVFVFCFHHSAWNIAESLFEKYLTYAFVVELLVKNSVQVSFWVEFDAAFLHVFHHNQGSDKSISGGAYWFRPRRSWQPPSILCLSSIPCWLCCSTISSSFGWLWSHLKFVSGVGDFQPKQQGK
jgi:hypothetical protein